MRSVISEVDRRLEGFITALPGRVSKVNDDGSVDVRPCINKVFLNGAVDMQNASIPSVQVVCTSTPIFSIKIPIHVGDPVLLLAFSRDAGAWKRNKGWKEGHVPKSATGNTLGDLVALQLCFADSESKSVLSVDDSGVVTLKSPDFIVEGPMHVKGNLHCEKDVSANDNGATCVSLALHTHTTAVGPSSPAAPPSPSPVDVPTEI